MDIKLLIEGNKLLKERNHCADFLTEIRFSTRTTAVIAGTEITDEEMVNEIEGILEKILRDRIVKIENEITNL